MVDLEKVLEERGARYGEFTGHAKVAQTFKEMLFIISLAHDKELPCYQKEALDMVFHKLGRIINGDNNFIDSWRDMVGYLQLVVNELEKTEGATDVRTQKLVVKNGKLTKVKDI